MPKRLKTSQKKKLEITEIEIRINQFKTLFPKLKTIFKPTL